MKLCKLSVVFAAVAVALAGTPASGQQLRTVTMARTTGSIGMVPLEFAVNRGYFKRQGLNVELITIRQSDVIIAATVTGDLNFMDIIPTAILASVRGLPIRTIGVVLKTAPYVLVAQSSLRSAADLKGKKIGVSSVGGMSAYLVREILARNGLNPDRDVTFLAVGGTTARSAALFGGTIDAALVVAPEDYVLERKGYRRLLFASDFATYPLSGVAASVDFLAKNRQLAISFLKGLIEGAKFTRQNKGEAVTFIKSYLKVPDDEAEKSYEFLLKQMPPDFVPEDSVIRSAMEFARSALKMPPEAVPDISKVRDWSFAEAAR
ncbi:MAG TPA: ABC transporter substrate-binding protein [Candidatus Binatia bacterium]|jgi:NitT/TauT family transport system substrate-binding protein